MHDLKLLLKSTGAAMEIGVTANSIKASGIALWWRPLSPWSVEDQTKMMAIFFDVVEVAFP